MTDGVDLIAAARDRHMSVHGWTAAHDAEHTERQLLLAAAVKARLRGEDYWPWRDSTPDLHNDDRLRDLAEAGALIAAEIDRMLAAGERA